MVRCGTVEGGGDDLTLDDRAHVGDLFGALVHEDDHEVHLGVVQFNGLGHLLDDHGLTGLGRGDDEATLALADGGDQVDDARCVGLGRGLHAQLLGGVDRGQLAEFAAGLGLLDRHAVDGVDANEGVVLLALALALAGQAHGTGDGVTGTQAPAAHVTERHVDVVRAGQVAGGAYEGVVLLDVEDAGDRREVVLAAARGAGLGVLTALAALATVLAALATVLAAFASLLAVLTVAATTTAALTAGATALGVVTVGQLDVQDGLDNRRVGLRGGLGALGGGQGQVERDVRGLDGALAHRAAAARATRGIGGRVGGGSLLGRLVGGRLLSLVGLLLGRGRGVLAGTLFLRGRGAGAVAQQLDQLGLTKLGDALEAAGGGQSLQLRQLHRRQRRGRLGGGFVAHEVILTGMRPQRAR